MESAQLTDTQEERQRNEAYQMTQMLHHLAPWIEKTDGEEVFGDWMQTLPVTMMMKLLGLWLTEESRYRLRKMLDFYLEDLEAVLPLGGDEIAALAAQLTGSDEDAREAARLRLTEGNLHYAVILAREYAGKGVPLIDLIQEANLGLMESLDAYGAGDGDLEDWLEKGARKALRALVKEEEGFARMQEDMTAAANRILETVKEQEAAEGRALSAEELAERLGMPVSRVEEVLKESAKAIRNAEK